MDKLYSHLISELTEGLAGLHDRPRPGPVPRLSEEQRGALRQLVLENLFFVPFLSLRCELGFGQQPL